MITNQFRKYLCHFHCSHWQNHLLNFTFIEKGPLVLVKTTFSSLFWNKLLIPHANCNGHIPFGMFHHILPQYDTLGFLGENIWVSSIGRCATLGYTAVHMMKVESKYLKKNNHFMRFIIASRHVHSSIQRLEGLGQILSYKTSSKKKRERIRIDTIEKLILDLWTSGSWLGGSGLFITKWRKNKLLISCSVTLQIISPQKQVCWR